MLRISRGLWLDVAEVKAGMLNWTGERFVPWANEPAVAYEHLHRYIWASGFVEGKKVLDLASGEGYGAEILACRAASVCGVDIDDDAIRHASERYRRPNLQFLKGSMTAVPLSEAGSFDVITCFEAIEHIEQHQEMMREVKRLLNPAGLFIASIPNKETYSVECGPNPFHVKEPGFEEFEGLLKEYFSVVSYLGQHVHTASSMWPLRKAAGNTVQEFGIERREGEFRAANGSRPALYFVAVASNAAGADFQASILLDYSNAFLKNKDEALAWRAKQVDELEGRVRAAEEEVRLKRAELAAIRRSKGWRFVLKMRAIRDKLWGK